jgi:hypothetical protein
MTHDARRKLEQDMCVDADAWAKAFMGIKKEADPHEVSLWFSSCLSTAFMHGQQSPRYASLQQGHLPKNNETSYSPPPSSVAA